MNGRERDNDSSAAVSIAYFWGEDAYGIEHAAELYAGELAASGGAQYDVWRTSGDDENAADGGTSDGAGRRRARVLEQIEQHLATAPLFSGGTLVVVRQPGSLLREATSRERLIRLTQEVAPGNALCFLDLVAAGAKAPAQSGVLRDAVAAQGGRVVEFPAPTRERMERWINDRAQELGVRLAPGAARLLAERVGAYVREADVDRRRQTEMANAELEKLALYRVDGVVSRDDVAELVSEAIPGSTWAWLDAIGYRRAADALALTGRLLAEATPLPVLVSQVHRRLRDLILIREHLDAGTRPQDLVREMRLQPYRAQKLSEQAGKWDAHQLDGALHALFELDLLSKGIAPDGSPHSLSDDRSELALLAWIGERVEGDRSPIGA